jgi:Invasion associated locus B (IalB) protein
MTTLIGRTLALAAIMLAGTAVSAQESTNRVATMTDWNVFVEENPKMCWGVSKPKETVNSRDGQPVSVRRGDILLFVTFNPGKAPEISFTGGYPFAAGSVVELNIDGTVYSMVPGTEGTENEWAWPGSAEEDSKLLAALKAGTTATLSARSGKGTQTVDTFSLRGFTAAMEDAEKRCQ